MKIIKDGKLIDLWIGKCANCGAVMEASEKELTKQEAQHISDNVLQHAPCPYCKIEMVWFNRADTSEARSVLRKSGLKAIYKREKMENVGIYAPGTK